VGSAGARLPVRGRGDDHGSPEVASSDRLGSRRRHHYHPRFSTNEGVAMRAQAVVALSICALVGCSEFEDEETSGSADWFSGSCAELGGSAGPSGACHVRCPVGKTWSGAPCGIAASRAPSGREVACGNDYHQYCRVDYCTTAADCGPRGWICDFGNCFFPCSTPSATASAECPAGMYCNKNSLSSHPNFCVSKSSSSSSCGEPCAAGCCSPSGSICCKPPVCAGDCVGSPCCR